MLFIYFDFLKKNLMRGLIAAASTAAFFIAACGFARFNYEERHPKRKESKIYLCNSICNT